MKKLYAMILCLTLLGCTMTGLGACNNKIHVYVTYEDADKYTATSRVVENVGSNFYINWLYGDVYIFCSNRDDFLIYENVVRGKYTQDNTMHYYVKDSNDIYIQYTANNYSYNGEVYKDLYLEIPYRYYSSFHIKSTEGNFFAEKLMAIDFELTLEEGDCEIEWGQIDHIDVACPKGQCYLDINAKLSRCNASTTSRDLTLLSETVPEQVNLSTTSGKIQLQLPFDAEFRLILKTTSGNFDTNYAFTNFKDYYICGSGTAKMNLTTNSGDVSVRY